MDPLIHTCQTLKLSITGMSCSSCVASIENAVSNLPGVSSCNVSLVQNSAHVLFNRSVITPAEIIQSISDMGFDATDATECPQENSSNTPHSLLFPVSFTCGVITCFVLLLQLFFPTLSQLQIINGLSVTDFILLLLASIVFILVIPPALSNFSNVIHSAATPNMYTLVFLSSIVSFLLSIWLLVYNVALRKHYFQLMFDSSVLVVSFTSFGKYLENKAKYKFSTTLSALSFQIAPTVSLLDLPPDFDPTSPDPSGGGGTPLGDLPVTSIDASVLSTLDPQRQTVVLRILPGESVPCDGIILGEAGSFINESLLTGESSPVYKNAGDNVYESTINMSHPIFVQMTAACDNTYAKQLVKMAGDAQLTKPQIQTFTDFLCKWFVYAVLCVSSLTFFVWIAIGLFTDVDLPAGFNAFTFAMYTGLSVLVVSCPCALGLAIPLSVVAACNVAFSKRVLLKNGGKTLQTLSRVHSVVFDKTGTLTYGTPKIVDSFGHDFFGIAKSIAAYSNHPLCKPINKLPSLPSSNADVRDIFCENVEEILGQGVSCSASFSTVDAEMMCNVKLGNSQWISQFASTSSNSVAHATVQEWTLSGKSIVLMAIDDEVVSGFAFVDVVRPDSKALIEFLNTSGVHSWILSGDSRPATLQVARQIGIPDEHVISTAGPTDKAKFIKALQGSRKAVHHSPFFNRWPWSSYQLLPSSTNDACKENGSSIVAFVGDGKNDSVALATADVGICFGTNAITCIDSASVVVAAASLSHIKLLIQLSKKMMTTIKLNLFWALSYNVFAIPVSAGIFFPNFVMNPLSASLAMTLSSLLVVATSMLFLFSFKRRLLR